MWSGWGLIDPLFSIFVIQNIKGSNLVAIGFLATIYWITKGILQIPISIFLDRYDGERDDFYALILGLLVIGMAAFSLIMATKMWQIYLIQFVKSIGFAFYIPAWSAIFSRHLDKEHTAFDWAFSSSSVSLGIGLAGLVGGTVASAVGFQLLFLLAGLFALLSAGLLLLVPNLILPRKTVAAPQLVDHVRAGIK